MTDLELTRLAAEAMGLPVATAESWDRFAKSAHAVWIHLDTLRDGSLYQYDPLHDDEQAMALMKRFGLLCDPQQDGQDFYKDPGWEVSHVSLPDEYLSISPNLNRAIVTCVALMHSSAAPERGGTSDGQNKA